MPSYSPLFNNDFPLRTYSSGLPRAFFRLARRTPVIRELLDTTIGAVAGSTANLTTARVRASTTEQGGKRPVDNVARLNRNTTSGDVSTLKDMFSKSSKIATPNNRAGKWSA